MGVGLQIYLHKFWHAAMAVPLKYNKNRRIMKG